MKVEDLSLRARDGMPLAATIFRPDNTTRRNSFVLITSAVGVKRTFYKKFATYLCDQGFGVLSFDYRGIGDSRPKSLFRFKATMSEWGEKDVAGMIDWIAAEHAHEELMVVGHSVGAQLVGLAPNNERIAAMISVAGQSGYWGLWSFPRKYLMAALWYLIVPSIFPRGGLGSEKICLAELSWSGPAGAAIRTTLSTTLVTQSANTLKSSRRPFSTTVLRTIFTLRSQPSNI
jgi:predicted alpha/beta hydrolase